MSGSTKFMRTISQMPGTQTLKKVREKLSHVTGLGKVFLDEVFEKQKMTILKRRAQYKPMEKSKHNTKPVEELS